MAWSKNCTKIFIGFLILLPAAGVVFAGGDKAETGQDFTKPPTGIDFRSKYQDLLGSGESWIFTLRTDKPFMLAGGKKLATRLDFPFMTTDAPAPDNPRGNAEWGMSDVLIQGLIITPPKEKTCLGFGTQMIFPTASKDGMGTGKYQLLPTVGFRYDMGGWMEGSWFTVLVRQAFDFASKEDDHPHIHQTYFQPAVNLDLPGLWFLTFAPESRYDWRVRKWHVPFDITVGKIGNPKTVTSLEYKSAMVDDLPLYDQEVEARIGFFF